MKLLSFRTKLLEAKKKAVENEKKNQASFIAGRWMIILLFGLTVLISLFFYLQSEIPLFWQRMTSPAVISTLPEGTKFDPEPVLTEIENLTQDLRGTYGVYVYSYQDGHQYGLHADELFPAASLIKLPVMLLVYQEAEKEKLDLAEYRAMIEAMGQRSDNSVFNRLVSFFGDKKIQGFIDGLGMEKTSLAENETTPAEIGLLFQKVYNLEIINQTNRDEMLDFLTETEFEDRIPAGLPEGIRVAHKIGTEIGSFSDAGIVFTEKPFIIVIVSKEAREAEANQVLPEITKVVWEFENEER